MTPVARAVEQTKTGENVTIRPKVAKEVTERSNDDPTKTLITDQ